MSDTPNICERIDAAAKTLASKGFTKSGEVKGSARYNFIPITQILEAVREAHAAAGVKVIFGRPEYDTENGEKRWTEIRKSRNPATGELYEVKWHLANGHIKVRLVGSSPEDCIETTIGFEAADNSDKLTNKIYTNAERCLYRTLYAIDESDGSDPEALNFENVVTNRMPKPKRPAVDVKTAKQVLARVMNESPGILDRYIQIAKTPKLNEWDEDIILKAYADVMDAEGSE